jgi:hypothetical protein
MLCYPSWEIHGEQPPFAGERHCAFVQFPLFSQFEHWQFTSGFIPYSPGRLRQKTLAFGVVWMPPDSKVQRYRRRAAELREMAAGAKSLDVQNELLVIAQQYDRLADDVERAAHDRKT